MALAWTLVVGSKRILNSIWVGNSSIQNQKAYIEVNKDTELAFETIELMVILN